jgi:peptide/nickel transport system ATP-binding protein
MLQVKNLTTVYSLKEGRLNAADNISFSVNQGEMFGLIGESGCGKSTLAVSILNRVQYPGKIESGEVFLEDIDILALSDAELRKILWNDISIIPQSAMNALNPVIKIKKQMQEIICLHSGGDKKTADHRSEELFDSVGLDIKWLNSYPHKLSGGMKQRVVIAMALACEPKIIISDESTTGLDVLVQAQILKLIKNIRKERNLSVIVISHDLQMITQFCDRIGIMYAGRLVEIASCTDIQENPVHPYTKALFNSQLAFGKFDVEIQSIPGLLPDLKNPPEGCLFYERCLLKMDKCRNSRPELKENSNSHAVACFYGNKI